MVRCFSISGCCWPSDGKQYEISSHDFSFRESKRDPPHLPHHVPGQTKLDSIFGRGMPHAIAETQAPSTAGRLGMQVRSGLAGLLVNPLHSLSILLSQTVPFWLSTTDARGRRTRKANQNMVVTFKLQNQSHMSGRRVAATVNDMGSRFILFTCPRPR
jgi:hypothetical protein